MMQVPYQSRLEENAVRRVRLIQTLSIAFLLAVLFAAPQSMPGTKALAQSRLATMACVQEEKPKPATPKDDETPSPASSQDRSELSLSKALLGHWALENGQNHMYYRNGVFTSVFSGQVQEVKYTLEEINQADRTIRLRITPVHVRILTFSEDNKSLVDVPEIAGVRVPPEKAYHWKFVDDRSKPAPETVQTTQDNEPGLTGVTGEPRDKSEFIIGDSRTRVFYWRGCPMFDKLPQSGRVYFKNKKDAEAAGYQAATDCPKK